MCVLRLTREGRRGELRFHHGELTSALAGRAHGLAAFHQLLLWPDARFDWRTESVVRQQQIPLSLAELSENAERFLRDYHEMSCGVSPSMVFDPNLPRLAELADWVPKEAQGVVELFDSKRSLADVIQDSPLRLPDTLRVAVKLIEVGVLRKVMPPRTLTTPTPAIVVEDWLVGAKPPATVVPTPVPTPPEPVPATAPPKDWGNLDAAKTAEFAPVVPAASQSGEIPVPPHILATPPVPANVSPSATLVASPPPAPAPVPAPAPAPAPAPVAREEPKKLGKTTGKRAAVKGKDTGKHKKAESGRHRAVKFEDHEQAFFDSEHDLGDGEGVEDFSDLDDGVPRRPGFFRRLWNGLQGKGADSEKRK